MCISKFFALFRKAKKQNNPTSYNPKCAYVRVDNIAQAAGVSMVQVNDAMCYLSIKPFKLLTGQRGKFVTNKDARIIYGYIKIESCE